MVDSRKTQLMIDQYPEGKIWYRVVVLSDGYFSIAATKLIPSQTRLVGNLFETLGSYRTLGDEFIINLVMTVGKNPMMDLETLEDLVLI